LFVHGFFSEAFFVLHDVKANIQYGECIRSKKKLK